MAGASLAAPPEAPLQKSISLLVRRSDLTPEQFKAIWIGEHGPGAREVPRLNGYVLSEITRRAQLPLPRVPGLPEIDIIGTSWLPADSTQRTPDTLERRAWLADGAAHFGSFRRYAMIEHVFVPAPN